MSGFAVQNGLIEGAEHEVPPAGRRFTQHNVDQLLGRAGELDVNLVDTDECYGDHLAEAHRVEG